MTGRRVLPVVCFAWLAYAPIFIWQTTVVVNGQRFAVLFDDAMVSMRYARNLAAGNGLVWNPGEQIEGITNLGWTLVMAAIHGLGFPRSFAALPVQVLSACCLLLNLVLVWKLACRLNQKSTGPALFAVVSTAWFLPLNNWSLQGMETGALALMASAACYGALDVLKTGRVPGWTWLVLGLATIVRLDAVVIGLAVLGWALVISPENRLRNLAWGGVAIGAGLASQTIFRLAYYGSLLPNTYHLKMTGFPVLFRITRGTAYTAFSAIQLLWPAAVLLGLLWRLGARYRLTVRGRFLGAVMLPVSVCGAVLAYSAYVGGDAWERIGGANRFIAPVMPLAFVAVGAVAARGIQAACEWKPQRRRLISRLAVAAIAVSLLNQNAYRGLESLRWAVLAAPPMFHHDNVRNVGLAQFIDSTTTPAAKVAIDYAGTAPYFSDRRFVDLLGKSDPVIARGPMHRGVIRSSPWLEFYPGHLKWDYAYSIGQLQPDMICAIWRRSEGDSGRYLAGLYLADDRDGVSVYWRQHSPRVRWDRVPASAAPFVPIAGTTGS